MEASQNIFVTKHGGENLAQNACQSLVDLIYDFVLNLENEQIGSLFRNVKQKFSQTTIFIENKIDLSLNQLKNLTDTVGLIFSPT